MKVLIAEDDSTSAIVLRKALEKLGHEAVVATDGDQAYALLSRDNHSIYRVVISDWMMPGMDGLELTRKIRSERKPGEPYRFVILLTARGRPEDRRAGLEAGADDFMVKPLDMGDLIPRLSIAERMLTLEDAVSRGQTPIPANNVAETPPTTLVETIPSEPAGEEAAKQILFTAVREYNATEVHFEPQSDTMYRVRIRGLDGFLQTVSFDSDTVATTIRYLTEQSKSPDKLFTVHLSDGNTLYIQLATTEYIDGSEYLVVRILQDTIIENSGVTLETLPMHSDTRQKLENLLLRSHYNGGMLVISGSIENAALVQQTRTALYNHVGNDRTFVIDVIKLRSKKREGTLVGLELQALKLRPDYLFTHADRGAGLANVLYACLTLNTFVISTIVSGQLTLLENRFNSIEYGYVPVPSRRTMFILTAHPLAADGSNANDRYSLQTADELFTSEPKS